MPDSYNNIVESGNTERNYEKITLRETNNKVANNCIRMHFKPSDYPKSLKLVSCWFSTLRGILRLMAHSTLHKNNNLS